MGDQASEGAVATPPPGASPEHVVQAFIDGINARDAAIVEHVATEGLVASVVESWFSVDLTHPEIGEAVEVAGETSVPVSFIPEGGDGSLPDDGLRVIWSVIVSDSLGEWVVTGMGQG